MDSVKEHKTKIIVAAAGIILASGIYLLYQNFHFARRGCSDFS